MARQEKTPNRHDNQPAKSYRSGRPELSQYQASPVKDVTNVPVRLEWEVPQMHEMPLHDTFLRRRPSCPNGVGGAWVIAPVRHESESRRRIVLAWRRALTALSRRIGANLTT